MIHLPTDAERAEALRILADLLVGSAVARVPLPPPAQQAVGVVAPGVVETVALEVARQLGVGQPKVAAKPRRKRKDPKMAKALKQANAKFRKKNGDLRAGATQAKLMSYAHKLRRKM